MLIKELCKEYFWIMPKTPKYNNNEKIPYITSKNLKNGIIDYSNCQYISIDDFEKLTTKRSIQEDDFLISMIGTIGEVGIVHKSDLPLYGQNMYLLRPNYNKVNKRFLYHFLSSSFLKEKLISIFSGSTQSYLRDKDIIEQSVKYYPMDQQVEIAKKLDNLEQLIYNKNQEIKGLDELKKARFIGEMMVC